VVQPAYSLCSRAVDTPIDRFAVFIIDRDVARSGSEPSLLEPLVPSWADAVELAIASRAQFAVIVAPGTILNHSFSSEVSSALEDEALTGIPWAAQFSNGVDISGAYLDCGNYLDAPAVPMRTPRRLAVEGSPAVSLIELRWLAHIPVSDRPRSPTGLVALAAQSGLPVYLTDALRYSSLGVPPLSDSTAAATASSIHPRRYRTDPTISIVVRSVTGRSGFLTRNLTSIAAQNSPPLLEVLVVSSGASPPEPNLRTPGGPETSLPIRYLAADASEIPSRTANLTAAINHAQGDYIWFVDDDDWIAPGALDAVTSAIHANDRPIIVGGVEAVSEEWDGPDLTSATPIRRYVPTEWYRAFTGWNHLPNCALVLPTELCRRRLRETPIVRDLGEDYALQLLMFSTPGASVSVTNSTIAYVSIRTEGDNSVTMADRTPWLRELGSHISDLSNDPVTAIPALWVLGDAVRLLRYPGPLTPEAEDPVSSEPSGIAGRGRAWVRRTLRRLSTSRDV
jgi:hypothetical protein